MVGRGNQHCVNIFALQQLSVIQIAIPVADVFGSSDSPLIHIRDRHDTHIVFARTLHQAGNMARPLPSTTDNPDSNSIVSPERRSGKHAGQGDRTDGKS